MMYRLDWAGCRTRSQAVGNPPARAGGQWLPRRGLQRLLQAEGAPPLAPRWAVDGPPPSGGLDVALTPGRAAGGRPRQVTATARRAPRARTSWKAGSLAALHHSWAGWRRGLEFSDRGLPPRCSCCPPGSLSASSSHLNAVGRLAGGRGPDVLSRCTFFGGLSRFSHHLMVHAIMGSVLVFYHYQTR
jgi:hypothetical protein